MSATRGNTRTAPEPVPRRPELAETPVPSTRLRQVGRVRVPLALGIAPWATLYELPDGRLLWCVRLWGGERPRARCVSTGTLLAYARASGLDELERSVRALVRTVEGERARA